MRSSDRSRRKNGEELVKAMKKLAEDQGKTLSQNDIDVIQKAGEAGQAARSGDTEFLEEYTKTLPRNPDGTYRLG